MLAGEVKLGAGVASIPMGLGLVISGNLAKLDWVVWKKYFVNWQNKITTVSSIIKNVNLDIAKLHIFGKKFQQVSLAAQPQKQGGWEVMFLTPDINGKVYFPHNNSQTIRGEFKKLYLDLGTKKQELSASKFKKLPPLNFVVDDFNFDGKKIANVKLIIEPRSSGIKINKLAFSGEKYDFIGSGSWLAIGKNQKSSIQGTIKSRDFGDLFKELHLTKNIVAGKGVVDLVLKWSDSIYKPKMTAISGAVAIAIKHGKIVHLGRRTENRLRLGNILNILSLQSIPKRLSLDFSDLLDRGFAFDTMQGDFILSNGIVKVNKLEIEGLVADVLAHGNIDLKNQYCDLILSIFPHVATSIPVAATATILGGPVAGVIGFVADNLITRITKKAVKKITTHSYHVTGPWDNPQLSKHP